MIASGVVTSAKAIPKRIGVARQTPCVTITLRRTAFAKRSLGRVELKPFSDRNDGRPQTEPIVGISDETAAFLRRFF